MKGALPTILLCCALFSPAADAAAATYRVSDMRRLEVLMEESARPGDVIEIAPGTYDFLFDRINIQRSGTPEAPIVVRGILDEEGRRPVIDASNVNIHRGLLTVGDGVHDIVIENLEISEARGARFPDRFPQYSGNASAIFFVGCHNITVRNCYFHHCENGLFSTHESDYILIDDCEIAYNGRYIGIGDRYRTHGFYFNSKHQMVRNSYIHDQTDSTNFKSRGDNTVFAFNWVEEDLAYALDTSSNNRLNTLYLGNVVMKRTMPGILQGRLFGVGDGTGVAGGTLVALNNTFVTVLPRDYYLFTFTTSTADVLFINNVFAGPGKVFMQKNGQGTITGANNWIQEAIANIPDALQGTISGGDAGFVDAAGRDFRLKAGSPLVDAGSTAEDYRKALSIALEHAASGSEASPSPEYLKALEEVSKSLPMYLPVRGTGNALRQDAGGIDIGAFGHAPAAQGE